MSRRFLRPYYLANALLIFSYFFLRRHLRPHNHFIASLLGGPVLLPAWETRVAGVLSLALSINGLKVRRSDPQMLLDDRLHPAATNELRSLARLGAGNDAAVEMPQSSLTSHIFSVDRPVRSTCRVLSVD